MAISRKILGVRFNQDHDCFTCCMESGVRIYNVDPLVEKTRYDLGTVGSIGFCQMLHRSNLIAMVPGGSHQKFPDNHMLIYDDLSKKFILDISFPSSVKSVRLRRDRLVVTLLNEIHVFKFPTPTQKMFKLETGVNIKGLCEISPLSSSERQILIYPGQKIGSVNILDLENYSKGITMFPSRISAHQGEIVCMVLNEPSTRLATASSRGTLIRVWDTTTRTKLVELRRGSDSATINCLSFSRDSEYLCCCSDKGTIHVFAIRNTDLNQRMTLPGVTLLGNYGCSQWGLTRINLPPETAAECVFGPNNSVYGERRFYLNPDKSKYVSMCISVHRGYVACVVIADTGNDTLVFDEKEWTELVKNKPVIDSLPKSEENVNTIDVGKFAVEFKQDQPNSIRIYSGDSSIRLNDESLSKLWLFLPILQYRMDVLNSLRFDVVMNILQLGVKKDIINRSLKVLETIKEINPEVYTLGLEVTYHHPELLQEEK